MNRTCCTTDEPIRRADAVERLNWSLTCARSRLEDATADSRRLVDVSLAGDDLTRERKALHLRARLEGLLRQVQETAADLLELREAAERVSEIEAS